MSDLDSKVEQAQRKFAEDLYERGLVAEDEASMKPYQTHVKDPKAPGGVRRVKFTGLYAPNSPPPSTMGGKD